MGFYPFSQPGLVTYVPASGDTTGATDSANVQALLTAGASVQLGTATYTFNAPWTPGTGASPGRVLGSGPFNTICKWVSTSAINAATSVTTDSFEVGSCQLVIPSGNTSDLITGCNCARWYLHDNQFVQNNAGNAIWNATLSGIQVMLECRFRRNTEYVFGATRSIEAWFLSSPSGSNLISNNSWRDNVCFNQGNDITHYHYHVQSTGSANGGNEFRNIVFEHPYGGMIWLESHTRALIENCLAYDVASATISNHLIQLSKNATGLASARNTIMNAPRNQSGVTFAASTGDIGLDANCVQTTIINPAASGDLAVYANGSTGLKVMNPGLPAGWLKDSATTAVAGAGAGTGPPAPVVTQGPTNEYGTITFGTGTAPAAGNQCVVTYGNPYNFTPNPVITPSTAALAALQPYVSASSASGFTVATGAAPSASQANTVYGFRWYGGS